ncbi:MAG: hypothetical protein WC342_02000 [Methanoregula sp.]
MKKFIVVLAVLFIGILFAGCTSQPSATTPTATPTPTAVPTTVETTAVPTTVATPEVTTNVTANVTATPTAVATVKQNVYKITFTQDLTVTPDTTAYVPVGTKVIWYNADPLKPHGIQATGVQTGKYFGDMSTHSIPYNGTFEVTFDKAGSYDYTTVFQPQINAKIVVS